MEDSPHDTFGELTDTLLETPGISMPSLQVTVDVNELLSRHDMDEGKVLNFLGKLKDLLA